MLGTSSPSSTSPISATNSETSSTPFERDAAMFSLKDSTASIIFNVKEKGTLCSDSSASSTSGTHAPAPTEDDKILVNSLLLSASSKFFLAMFANGMRESTQKESTIQVSKENRPYFKDLIRFLYTGKFETKGVALLRVLILADQYEIESAIGESSRLMGESFASVGACCEVVDFLGHLPSNRAFIPVISQCRTYLHQQFANFDDEHTQKEFVENLSSARSAAIVLTNSEMKVASENTVFQIVKKWLLHEPSRIQQASFLLPFVRYHLMSTDFLRCVVLNNDIFNHFNPQLMLKVKDIIAQSLVYSMSTPERKKILTSLQDGVRKKVMQPRASNPDSQYVPYYAEVSTNFDEPFETRMFFVHGYYMYLRFEKGEHSGHQQLVMCLNINLKETGINVNQNFTTMHFRVLFKNPNTGQYQLIHAENDCKN
eukprot:TRINITY_DN5115_c0_g1_i3.p1 TRINITY_DN5115_c0_g1~~TRINITY_DN5115_c0_g1_i3.p1  ORF type:complete len:428 (-),score=117.75 TRINITY_DN5115_c0_g1_i3:185-1468(-)